MVNPAATSTSTLQSSRLNLACVAIAGLVTLISATVSDASPGARYGAETVRRNASMRLSAAGGHVCHVKEDGSVRCWGNNDQGQLGNGNTTDQPIPVPVNGLTGVIAVAAGGEGTDSPGGFTCAVLVGGTVRCWGANELGQLGAGTSGGPRLTPVAVSGLSDAIAITAGDDHACSLHSTGTVRCWGKNDQGQLGDGTTVDRVIPVRVSDVSNAVQVSAGHDYTCALLVDGTVRCWGTNFGGQLGDGTSGTNRSRAVVVAGLNRVKSIAAGGEHTCALLADGTARCWGANNYGGLGNGTVNWSNSPVFVNGVTNATSISAGSFVTCVSLADGTARCWGFNSFGQVGNSVTTARELNAVAVTGLPTAVVIATSGSVSCALLAQDSVVCWGSNFSGTLGTGTPASFRSFPAPVHGGGGGFSARDVAAGRNHTCAVRATGTVACWGDNDFGQLGDGTAGVDRLVPVTVTGLSNVVALTAGDAHACALQVTGLVRCWGDNRSGQLGIGTSTIRFSALPVMVPNLTNVLAISAGGGIAGSHTCALLANGQLRCWGANANGQLGDGSTTTRLSPVPVPGETFMTAIAAGELHTCALRATGIVRCWGSNANGQLGDNTQIDHRRPADVTGMGFAAAVATGNLHSCALQANASVWCWGENLLGQLGNSSTTPSPLPVEALSGLVKNRTVAIAGGFGHTCAVIFSGAARCWGDNSVGQLGNSTTTSNTAPVVVESVRTFNTIGFGGAAGTVTIRTPLSNGVTITTGRRHTCALLSTGGVSCWGDNASGQLGIGSTTNALAPVAVPSFTVNIDTTVVLAADHRAATVTIVANCDAGETVHFDVTVTQGEVSGTGQASGRCTGVLARYPLRVQLQAGNVFTEDAAQVGALAIIKNDRAVEPQEWTRNVTIVRVP